MNSKFAQPLIPLILVGTLFFDWATPLGYELWVGHLSAVLLALWVDRPSAPYVVAAIATVFIQLGFMLSPSGIPLDVGIFNRIEGIVLVWVAAGFVGRAKTAKLSEATRRLGAIVDGSNDAILGLTSDGRVASWNVGAERLFGFTAAEMAGRSIQMLIPANLHHDEARLWAQVQEGMHIQAYDTVRMTKDGRRLDVSVTLSPLKDDRDQVVGVSNIIRDISERKRVLALLQQAHEELEMRIRDRTAELSTANDSLRELSSRLIQVQEEERSRIARDLHDEIGQLLTALKIDLQQVQRSEAGKALPGSLTDSLELVDRLLAQVRTLALDLRPSLLDDLGLVPALRWYANRQAKRNGWILSLSVEGMTGRIPAPVEVACFRIMQEALTNVAKYARANTIDLTLRRQGQEVMLVIQDDGVGFDMLSAQQRAQGGESMGLLGMEERARLAGGSLVISSTPGHGTRLHLRFPLPEHDQTKPRGTVEVMSP